MLYAYKVDSKNLEIVIERDVAEDHKSGKTDPGKFISLERFAKNLKQKKNKTLNIKYPNQYAK